MHAVLGVLDARRIRRTWYSGYSAYSIDEQGRGVCAVKPTLSHALDELFCVRYVLRAPGALTGAPVSMWTTTAAMQIKEERIQLFIHSQCAAAGWEGGVEASAAERCAVRIVVVRALGKVGFSLRRNNHCIVAGQRWTVNSTAIVYYEAFSESLIPMPHFHPCRPVA